MTEHVRDKEPETAVEPGSGRLLELLGLTLVAGAGVLFVVRPEFYEAGVHLFASRAASLAH
ncbi:hypothetical protein [Streptomyces sp. Go-475]|uniref:hypothetical protein n=1 Tax=Streptomyces sp. Go-475 TaxID=2072505 RepID=UPI000DF04FF0|nr:hypothetical protein [Streptomyces sp. Go-475]AXE87460.1 hypothetical protein C1703_20895 [Streptomyces sp. Go-475]